MIVQCPKCGADIDFPGDMTLGRTLIMCQEIGCDGELEIDV